MAQYGLNNGKAEYTPVRNWDRGNSADHEEDKSSRPFDAK